MARVLTRAEAITAQEERATERDQIQANLMELDTSFGKRLLERGSLTGTTKLSWDAASTELAALWETFASYAEVVRRAGELLAGTRHPGVVLLAKVSDLLAGPSVRLAGAQVPLDARQLTSAAQPIEQATLPTAVERMTTGFRRVTEVVGATERVWNEVSDHLDEIDAVLGPTLRLADSVADGELNGAIASTDAELRRIRGVLTTDPLSLWHGDGVDTSGLDDLLRQAKAVAARAGEVAKLKQDADRRIAETAAKVAAAKACEADAAQIRGEAAQKIAAEQLAAAPSATAQLASRLAGLDGIKAAGRWQRLAAELEAIETDAVVAVAQWQDAGRAAKALLNRRSELRGLLDAYRAKARRQGAAENIELAAVYRRARDLLRDAPCDLRAADDAVRLYQQAVLGLSGGSP